MKGMVFDMIELKEGAQTWPYIDGISDFDDDDDDDLDC